MSDLNLLENVAAKVDEEIASEYDEKMGINEEVEEEAPPVVLPPLRDEIADMLDMVAKVGGMTLPTMPQRFNHEVNLNIADNLIKLADKYNYDLRGALLDTDSVLYAWLGLAFALAPPVQACIADYKELNKEREAEKTQQESKPQPSPVKQDDAAKEGEINSVVSGGVASGQ